MRHNCRDEYEKCDAIGGRDVGGSCILLQPRKEHVIRFVSYGWLVFCCNVPARLPTTLTYLKVSD